MTDRGFSLIEIIVSVVVFLLVVVAFGGALTYSQGQMTGGGERTRAVMIAEEGLEAVRNIRDDDFTNLTDGTHGLAVSGNEWIFSGSSDVVDKFTRQIQIGTIDASTKQVTSTVSWTSSLLRPVSINLVVNYTYWQEERGGGYWLEIDPSNNVLTSGDKQIEGVTIENTDTDNDIVITHMTLTWDNTNQLDKLTIGGTTVWSKTGPGTPSGLQSSGTEINIVDYTLAVGSGEVEIDEIKFNGVMSGATVSILFTLSDSTTATTEFVLGADTTPPAAITDMILSGATQNSIDLDWTAPGDDGSVGTATSYDVRYSTSVINDGNWVAATQATGEPTPSVAGTAESMTVAGLTAGTTYYFAIKTSDDIPNESALSNVPSLATSAAGPVTIFHETFPNSDRRWNGSSDTAQDESGWIVYQGNGDINDVQVSNEDSGSSPSGGTHLTFEDCDQGWGSPESYDNVYVGIDLSGHNTVNLEYYWQSDDVDNNEGMRAAYSTDSTNGIDGSWTQLVEYSNPSPDDTWTQATFSIPDVSAVANFKLRFTSKSSRANEHMYVDDAKLTGIAN